MPFSLHRGFRGGFISAARAWSRTDERWKFVSHADTIRPKTRRSTVTIEKWIDADPLGVRPRTHIYNRGQLVDIKRGSG